MKKVVVGVILISIFIILFAFFSNWIHESAHIAQYKEQGIDSYYRFYGLSFGEIAKTEDFKIGEAIPSSVKDCERFNSLSKTDREKITHAGVIRQLTVFVPLFFISTLFWVLLIKKGSRKNTLMFWLTSFLAFVSLVIILSTLWNNVFTDDPLADWNRLTLNCSIYG